MKILFKILFFCQLVFFLQVSGAHQPLDKKLWERAQKIHREAVVVDAHGHPFYFGAKEADWNLGVDSDASQLDLPKLEKGGVDVVFYSLPIRFEKDRTTKEELLKDSAETMTMLMKKHADRGTVVTSMGELKEALRLGKKAVVLTIEDQDIYDGDSNQVQVYQRMGYRSIVLSHSKKDLIERAEKWDDPQNGLNDFGREIVAKMNREGILVDITHNPDTVQLDIIGTSSVPVICSHSCTRALNDRPRNVPDPIIRELAKKDGVICVTFGGSHSDPVYAEAYQEARAKFKKIEDQIKKDIKDDPEKRDQAIQEAWEKAIPQAPAIEKLIDHIDHIVKLVGADHVGLGSDYGGDRINYTMDLEHAGTWPLITYHLLKRGYTEEAIKKILGENVLRVLAAAEKSKK